MSKDRQYRWPFLDEIREEVETAIYDAKCKDEGSACITYNTNDGYIDVWLNDSGDYEVIVYHDDNRDTEHSRLEELIISALPAWDDVDEPEPFDEWNEHGFCDEADYNRWRYYS